MSYGQKTGFFQKHACFFGGENTIFTQSHLATNITKHKWSWLTFWTFLYFESTFFVQSFRSYGQKYTFLQKDACLFLGGENTIFHQSHLATKFTKHKRSQLTSQVFFYLGSTFFVQPFRSYGHSIFATKKTRVFLEKFGFLAIAHKRFDKKCWLQVLKCPRGQSGSFMFSKVGHQRALKKD